jgi:tetratricopeptide (TPR) repeat protein
MHKSIRSPFGSCCLIGFSLSLGLLAGCSRDPNVRKLKYLESGKRYEAEGKNREAVIQFLNALKVDKNYSDAHYELAMTYLKMGTVAGAYGELAKTVDLNPSNQKARLQMGNMLLAAGFVDRATDQAQAVLALNANNSDAYSLEASIAARKGQPADALKLIQHALEIDPNRSEYHTTLALLESRQPDGGPKAEAELQTAIQKDGKNLTAHLVLASMLEKKGDAAGAEREVQEAIKISPKDLQARRDLAGVYLRAGNKQQAEQTLREASSELSDTAEGASVLSDYYLSRGDVAAAESAYADLVAKNPKSFELRFAYARILVINHEDAKAQTIADQLVKENAKSPEVQVLKASLLLNNHKVDEAAEVLKKALKDSPDNLQLLVAYAKVSTLRGDRATAESSLRDAAKIAPANLDVASGLAEVASAKGDNSMLAQIAESTLLRNPAYPPAYLWRATAEANEKQYDKAKEDYHTVLQRSPNDVSAMLGLGQIAVVENHGPEGLALYQKALEIQPNSVAALDRIVSYYFGQKKRDLALAAVKDQVAKEPNNAAFLNTLAVVDLQMQDFAGARDAAQHAVQITPDNEVGIQALAQAEGALGDKDGAIAAWQKWLATHPNDAKADTMVAQLEDSKGDQQKAMDYYWKAVNLEPGQAMASNNLAYLMTERKMDLNIALRLAQDARNKLPDSPSTADTLAWVYYNKERYPTARDLLEEAVKSDPNSPEIQYHLGMTYQKLGDRTDADLHLKKAASLAPDSKAGKDAALALTQLPI